MTDETDDARWNDVPVDPRSEEERLAELVFEDDPAGYRVCYTDRRTLGQDFYIAGERVVDYREVIDTDTEEDIENGAEDPLDFWSEFADCGGTLAFDGYDGSFAGIRAFRHIERLFITGSGGVFHHLEYFPNVKTVVIDGTTLGCLDYLVALPNLVAVRLENCCMGFDEPSHPEKLTSLRALEIVTPEKRLSLDALAAIPSLEVFRLAAPCPVSRMVRAAGKLKTLRRAEFEQIEPPQDDADGDEA